MQLMRLLWLLSEMAYMENGLQVMQSNLSFSCENGYQYIKYYCYIKNAMCF